VRLALDWAPLDKIGTLPDAWTVAHEEHTDMGSGYTAEGNFVCTRNILGYELFRPVDYLRDHVMGALGNVITQGISPNVQIDSIHLVPIEAPGTNIQTEVGVSGATLTYSTKPKGTGSGQMLPAEVSLAWSFHTEAAGRRGKGRIYLPPQTTAAVSSGGRLDFSHTESYAAAAQAFINGLMVGTGITPGTLVIRPIVSSRPFEKYGVITEVAVGDVFDSQRRRRNQLSEKYSTRAVNA
jgi:hypothetical protein